MFKNLGALVSTKIHQNLTKTDIEAFSWVGFGLGVYFGFITVCYFGAKYHG